MLAVQENGLVLDKVEEQTLEICLAAVERTRAAIWHVRDPLMEDAIRHYYRMRGGRLLEDVDLHPEFTRENRPHYQKGTL